MSTSSSSSSSSSIPQAPPLPPPPPPPLFKLSDLHESVIARVLDLAGPRSKAAASLVLGSARRAVLTNASAWSVLRFRQASEQSGLRFEDLSRMMRLADGGVEELSLAR